MAAYLATGRFPKAIGLSAKHWLDTEAGEILHPPCDMARRLLERDAEIAGCDAHASLRGAAPPNTLRLLDQVHFLIQLDKLDHVTGCDLLTLALEEHLRHHMATGLPGRDRARLQGAGLRSLGLFLRGRRVSRLEGLRLEPTTAHLPEDVLNGLDAAGRIRNKVHHESHLLGEPDFRRMRRMLLDPRGPRLLHATQGLRCVR